MKANELLDALKQTGTGPYYLRVFRDVIAGKILSAEKEDDIRAADDAKYLEKCIDRAARDIDATELVNQTIAACALKHDGFAYDVTIAKAKKIMVSANLKETIKEINGKPPQQSREASEERLAKLLAERNGEVVEITLTRVFEKQARAQADGIGNPQKPVGVGAGK